MLCIMTSISYRVVSLVFYFPDTKFLENLGLQEDIIPSSLTVLLLLIARVSW